MNDKQQLAAMGDELRLTEEQAKALAERMPQAGTLQILDDEPLCMAKRIEELEAQVLVMAGLLREARKYVTALGKPDDEVPAVQMTVSRIDALLAGQAPAPFAPEGWQLVPVELMALLGSMVDLHSRRGVVLTVEMESLAEMLAAAPSQDGAK